MFMDATNEKMNAPVQVSFLNVRAFTQDVEVNTWYAQPDFFVPILHKENHYTVYPCLL